ncbi:cytoplasmic tRNA 2-thiolation protein 1 [Allomyces macrogynus ATCC 38327]|uniref:Cytoplasmic tRNA 2-thiolation protein 1 n=1 Tax=Allomyces macrogynus (strain ATCC 38327) TaxID=578462 RepID=A0A0L0T932_ALLM3|nr:cytoplasmic tRNA 2-thiolation protein 1 [Allomyces macrogynus ATCC 38327]|eukprot:KNE71226.1 cytoplasmic tRNA 2-thiolation protein 1 [Allomyces macrogynus ATCC 38327]
MPACQRCTTARAALKRPKTGESVCKACFYLAFETEIHETITTNHLFRRGEKVAIGASGGKDSTVLAHVLHLLNQRYDYGLDLVLLSVDEGITGYRDDSLATVQRNQVQYGLPLKIVSYGDLYGWTMDEIVAQVGLKNNCTFCGVFRRQALDRGAVLLGVDHIVTGHNADDIAETVLMNILRGDIARLQRCTSILNNNDGTIKRSKPFKYTYEKEIVMYAYFKNLDYFSTECIYAPQAYRGYARTFLKDLEAIRPSAILDIIHSGEAFAAPSDPPSAKTTAAPAHAHGEKPAQRDAGECERCGYMSSQRVCKACVLLEGLNRGLPRLGIGKTDRLRRRHNLHEATSPETLGRTIEHMANVRLEAARASPAAAASPPTPPPPAGAAGVGVGEPSTALSAPSAAAATARGVGVANNDAPRLASRGALMEL